MPLNCKINVDIKEIFYIIKEVGKSSTTHGIPNIIKNKNILIKILWLICFLTTTAYCIYGLCKNFQNFLNNQVVTQITNNRVNSLEFPTVTFCNKNPFDLSKNTSISNDLKNFLKNIKANNHQFLKLGTLEITKLDKFLTSYTALMFFNESINFTYSIEDMLLNCRFNDKPCALNDFEWYYTSKFGSCYKFNSGFNFTGHSIKKKKTTAPGRRNSLNLELFIGYSNLTYDLIRTKGAHLFVHNSSTQPLSDVEGISLPTGYETDVVIKQTFIKKLSKPYSDCIINTTSKDSFDSKLFKQTIELNEIYQQKYCLQLCAQNYLIEKCGCFDSFSPDPKVSYPCNDSPAILCMLNEYEKFYETTKSSKCFNSCPQECNTIEFDLKLSQADFPSPYYSDLLIKYDKFYSNKSKNFLNKDQLKNSVLAVNVFYDDISYKLIEEQPAKTFEQFVADIGGFMGLCVGISLLSFVELIEIFLKIIIYLFKSKELEFDPKSLPV